MTYISEMHTCTDKVQYGYGANATFNNISVIYRGGQFYWWRKPEYSEKTTNLPHTIDKLY